MTGIIMAILIGIALGIVIGVIMLLVVHGLRHRSVTLLRAQTSLLSPVQSSCSVIIYRLYVRFSVRNMPSIFLLAIVF